MTPPGMAGPDEAVDAAAAALESGVVDDAVRDPALAAFAAVVGGQRAVCVAGGRTHWEVGGLPVAGTREVEAPRGVVSHQPAEMIVRVRAGTTVAELTDAIAPAGQMVPLHPADPERATVGGVLSAGRSGIHRLRWGPLRDTLLEARFVDAGGRAIRAGGPLVKNVTGFDLCRLLVGSLGTLGCLGEVVLRCLPVPATTRWWAADGIDPFALSVRLYRPGAVLWDGTRTWVCLLGDPADVTDQAATVLGAPFAEVAGPPALPGTTRWSVPPGRLRDLPGTGWLAEVGVGTVHLADDATSPTRPVDPAIGILHERLRARFDPDGRLNPGRHVLGRDHARGIMP